jgi:hypothetical protein
MYTEDQIGKAIRRGEMTVEQAAELFSGDDVYVYDLDELDPQTATWGEVEDRTQSVLFHVLWQAGATDEQIAFFRYEMERHRAAGRTIESLSTKP